jgi:hypothetical protein
MASKKQVKASADEVQVVDVSREDSQQTKPSEKAPLHETLAPVITALPKALRWIQESRSKKVVKKKGVFRKVARGVDLAFAVTPWVKLSRSLILRPIFSVIGKVGAYYEMYQYFKAKRRDTDQGEAATNRDNVVQLIPTPQGKISDEPIKSLSTRPAFLNKAFKEAKENEVLMGMLFSEIVIIIFSGWSLYSAQDLTVSILARAPALVALVVLPLVVAIQIRSAIRQSK